MLKAIQENLYKQALQFQEEHTYQVSSFEEFEKQIEKSPGFFEVNWCESAECEEFVQQKTKATSRLIIDESKAQGMCFACGKEAKVKALFARAY